MTNENDPSLARQLRSIIKDHQDMYNAAKLEDNHKGASDLGKIIAGMTKQLKDQEIYERETLTRDEVTAMFSNAGDMIGRAIKEHVGGDEADLIIDTIYFELEKLSEQRQ